MVKTFLWTATGPEAQGEASDLAEASSRLPAGAYTTLRTYAGQRFVRLDAHLRRLEQSAARHDAPQPLDRAAVRALLGHALAVGGAPLLRLRLTFAPPHLFVSVEPLRLLPAALYESGARCVTVAARRANPQAKDTRFLAEAQQTAGALPAGIHEGLMLSDDGAILEGLSSNFFGFRAGALHTEPLRVLQGVTRGLVLDAARGLVSVVATPVLRAELPLLDECFLTSASRGVLPVVEIDGLAIGSGRPGPLTQQLAGRFAALVEQEARPL